MVEVLRVELIRAKERAQFSDATAEGASVELKAEQVAQCRGEEKVSTMTLALENATDRASLASCWPLSSSIVKALFSFSSNSQPPVAFSKASVIMDTFSSPWHHASCSALSSTDASSAAASLSRDRSLARTSYA